MENRDAYKSKREYISAKSKIIGNINNKVGEITNSGLRENSKALPYSSTKQKFRELCNEIIGHQRNNLDTLSVEELNDFYYKVLDFYDCYLEIKKLYNNYTSFRRKINDSVTEDKFVIGSTFYMGRCQSKKILWKIYDMDENKILIVPNDALYKFSFPDYITSQALRGNYDDYSSKLEGYFEKIIKQIGDFYKGELKINDGRMSLLTALDVLKFFPTKKSRKANMITDDKEISWMLGDVLTNSRYIMIVTKDGEIKETLLKNKELGIRPALWINKSSIVNKIEFEN